MNQNENDFIIRTTVFLSNRKNVVRINDSCVMRVPGAITSLGSKVNFVHSVMFKTLNPLSFRTCRA